MVLENTSWRGGFPRAAIRPQTLDDPPVARHKEPVQGVAHRGVSQIAVFVLWQCRGDGPKSLRDLGETLCGAARAQGTLDFAQEARTDVLFAHMLGEHLR